MVKVESLYSVIKSPVMTEKTSQLGADNKYAFWVDKRSNKIEIRKAVELVYKVKVDSVNIIMVRGKKKRLRYGQEGKKPDWKKALVTLKKGESINLYK